MAVIGKAVPCMVNGIRFDSKLEATAYQMLIQIFGKSRVSCHESVAYSSNSGCIPHLNHRIDFVIRDERGNPIRYVEVKGKLTGAWKGKNEYIRTLMLLEALKPEVWSKYVLWVGSGDDMISERNGPCHFVFPFPSKLSEVKPSLFLGANHE